MKSMFDLTDAERKQGNVENIKHLIAIDKKRLDIWCLTDEMRQEITTEIDYLEKWLEELKQA